MDDLEISVKRKRSANWDNLEKNLLQSCIKEYLSIIENKHTDTNTNKAKRACWLKIERRFNELTTSQRRSLTEIKHQWKGAKTDARRKISRTSDGGKSLAPDPLTLEIVNAMDLNMYNSYGNPNTTNDINDGNTCNELADFELNDMEPPRPQSATSTDNTDNEEPIDVKPFINTQICEMEVTTQKPTLRSCKKKIPFNETRNRDSVLAQCVQAEHKLKMVQMTEKHAWARSEHELRMEETKLRIHNIRLETLVLKHKLNKL